MTETVPSTSIGPWQALFVFQCKGIQPFVLGSDKLKDMLGATEIVASLPEKSLNNTLDFLGLKGTCFPISQASGSARVLFRTMEDARKLARIWPMVCAHAAPGMEAVQTVQDIMGGDYLEAVRRAEKDLVCQRNQPLASLPEIMPAVLRSSRTGNSTVECWTPKNDKGERTGDDEDLDAATVVKRLARRDSRQDRKNKDKFPAIYTRFGLEDPQENCERVPKMMEDLSGDGTSLAVIHADGNGVGQMFIRLEAELKRLPGLDAPAFYQALSQGIIEIGDAAAKAALLAVRPQLDEAAKKTGFWPLLPIVLAGDDLTVVLRADLAVPFTKTFLQSFECESRALFTRLLADARFAPFAEGLRVALGSCFTAGAGIAYVKSKYPFALAYQLCESLAGFAKRTAKAKAHLRSDGLPPSTVAFHEVAGDTVRESYAELLDSELLGSAGIRMSLAPYVVGENAAAGKPLPALAQLDTLATAARAVPKGQVRELLRLLREDKAGIEKHYKRFREQDTNEAAQKKRKEFADALDALLGTTGGKCYDESVTPNVTPLQDAWTLAGLTPRENDDR